MGTPRLFKTASRFVPIHHLGRGLVSAVLFGAALGHGMVAAQTLPKDSVAANKPSAPVSSKPEDRTLASGYRIEDLVDLARKDGLALEAVRLQSEVSRAGILTAQVRPNPEISWITGNVRAAQVGGAQGGANSFTLSQRIENPDLRTARIDVAKIGLESSDLNIAVLENNLVAAIKARYFEVLKRQEEISAAKEELQLTEQIRERVAIRFKSGEGARFDLLRAETEVALAEKELAKINSKLVEARVLLRQVVSTTLPEDFVLQEQQFPKLGQTRLGETTLQGLLDSAKVQNPEIQRSLSDLARAEKRILLEQAAINPGVSLQLGHDREPDFRSTRIGVAVNVPLWDRKQGPIAEARGLAARNKTDTELLRFELEQTLRAAWQQYQAALNSVQAFEGGILERASNVVRIAEAAYRLGERGILEYLDSRRQFRAVRAELIVARLELQLAITELERLVATPLRKIK